MCIIENPNVSFNDIFNDLQNRLLREKININRVKRFYNNEESFNILMNRLIEKDTKRFEKLFDDQIPNSWKFFNIILNIVQEEGTEIEPFDTMTKMLPSRSLLYYGWTFSWVHGEGTLISIFNPENELVYRF